VVVPEEPEDSNSCLTEEHFYDESINSHGTFSLCFNHCFCNGLRRCELGYCTGKAKLTE